jgi:hypothetical protein
MLGELLRVVRASMPSQNEAVVRNIHTEIVNASAEPALNVDF